MASSRRHFTKFVLACSLLALMAPPAEAKKLKFQKAQPTGDQQLDQYIQQAMKVPAQSNSTLGSLWNPNGLLTDMARDYKASRVGDMVTINIVEQTSAAASGVAKTGRTFSAQSSLTAFFGALNPHKGVNNLFTPNSTSSLDGEAQTSSSSTLTTSLSGTVVQVLPNGYLVVQASREVSVNNQKQQVILRGVVRPGDLATDNSVPSTAIANLVVGVAGKGVISDGTRPPNKLTRTLLKLVGF